MNSNSKRSTEVNKILKSHHIETEFKLCNFSFYPELVNWLWEAYLVRDFGLHNYRQSDERCNKAPRNIF